jgi:hypothetical protein
MDGEVEGEMRGSMQAVTSFELEAVRRQEVLLADANSGQRDTTERTDARETSRRVARRLGAVAGAVAALVAGGGAPAAGTTRT